MRDLIIEDFECKYSILVLSSCNITVWDNKFTRFSKKILSKEERNMINLTYFQKSMIVGILLSDGHIEKNNGWNARIRIEHSIKNIEYIWYVYNQLSVLVNAIPLLIKRKFRAKIFYSLAFRTRQLLCLNEMYELFYDNSTCKKKIIKPDLFHYMNYITLAYWIMGDGSKLGNGIILCTDSFTLKEVILLMNILKIKFDVDSSLHFRYSVSPKDRKTLLNKGEKIARIYINGSNFNKIKYKIKPFFTKDFLYKL